MNYCNASNNKEHLMDLIEWIYKEAMSSGGDGDFLWYSRYYNTKDLFPLVKEFNNSLKFKMETLSINNGTIDWSSGQTNITITNDKVLYDNAPSWQQGLLKY